MKPNYLPFLRLPFWKEYQGEESLSLLPLLMNLRPDDFTLQIKDYLDFIQELHHQGATPTFSLWSLLVWYFSKFSKFGKICSHQSQNGNPPPPSLNPNWMTYDKTCDQLR
jgi:hypothetical protein